jgi:hypothetical protein
VINRRNDPLRERWENIIWFERMAQQYKETANAMNLSDKIARMKRRVRRDSRCGEDRLAKPLTEEWRSVFRADGESVTEFRIIPGDWSDMSDEELDAEIRKIEQHSYSQYDCTGKLCTAWLTWKRVGAGLSVCHCMVLDV